jgi:probable F420-dependent oxidoreductase
MVPFRFAVQFSKAASGAAWRDAARKVEGLGYSTLFMPDHFGDQYGPLVALTVAAEATTDLRVGSLVFDNDYRHPVVLAKEVATLDLLSEGRVEFGLGAGWMTSDYEQSGIPNDSPGTRIDRMTESLAIMKSLWSDGRATLAGKHYTITEAVGTPTPHQRPYPPIIIGGGGKRILTLAGREADIVGINPNLAAGYIGPEVAANTLVEFYRQRVEWVRSAAGDRFDQLELQVLTFLVQVVPTGREVLEQMAPLLSTTPEALAEIPIALVGTVDEIVETLQRRREELGFSYIVIQEAEIDAFAPVVARLTGT